MRLRLLRKFSYPACYLSKQETAILDKSPFIHDELPATFKGRGRFIYPYAGGCFVHVGGDDWEERKTGSDTIIRFARRGGEDAFIHLCDSNRKPGAWIALPKEGKGNGIFFMWQGESWRKLSDARR